LKPPKPIVAPPRLTLLALFAGLFSYAIHGRADAPRVALPKASTKPGKRLD
jgi:hypothetical protein